MLHFVGLNLMKQNNDKIIQIEYGYNFTLFLTLNGNIFYCGHLLDSINNSNNILCQSISKPTKINVLKNITKIKCGYKHCLCLSDISNNNNNLWIFGLNGLG